MLRIKESGKNPFKVTSTKPGWLESVMTRTDALGRSAQQVFDQYDIEIVHGKERADVGLSMHGNPVQGLPKRKCILFKGEPPIYNLFFGMRLNQPHFLKKFKGVMANSMVKGVDMVHTLSPQYFCLNDGTPYVDIYFDRPKTEFLTMILRNKQITRKINRFIPWMRKYNKLNLNLFRIYMDNQFARLIPESYHSYSLDAGWNPRCYKGPIPRKIKGEYTPVYGVLSKYKFNFCPENSQFNGYVTEKPFQAILCGSIPLYLGAPNVYDYLPFGTFIHLKSTASPATLEPVEIIKKIQEMDDSDYNKYRKRMKQFITSKEADPFSSYIFAQKLIDLIGL